MTGTLRSARADLAATLTAAALPGVTVIGHEPAALARGVTVTVASSGVQPTEWLLAVRVYVNGIQTDDAQDTLDDAVVAVDAVLVSVPRSEWVFEWDDARSAFVATTQVLYARDDF